MRNKLVTIVITLLCGVVFTPLASHSSPLVRTLPNDEGVQRSSSTTDLPATTREPIRTLDQLRAVAELEKSIDDATVADQTVRSKKQNNRKAGKDTQRARRIDKQGKRHKQEFLPDKLLVKYKKGVTEKTRKQGRLKRKFKKIKGYKRHRLDRVQIPDGMSVKEAIASLARDPNVEYAEPDYLLSADQTIPADQGFDQLWGMHNTGQNGATPDADIDAPEAWDRNRGTRDNVVMIIDTGAAYDHPDLAANIWTNEAEANGQAGIDDDGNGYIDDLHGIDPYNGDSDPYDDNGHGTHVAGTIGAVGDNNKGVVGVNWQISMMPCKFLGASGSGATSDAIECLEYALEMKERHHVNIVATNNSWGGGDYSQALKEAIAAQDDILFIAAAGNDAQDADSYVHYPAGYDLDSIISVAATDRNDTLASFSNYGHRTVDIAAPGLSIYSTMAGSGSAGDPSWYKTYSGTSMATPHVTGLAALLKSQDRHRDAQAIKRLILLGGDPVAALDGKVATGRRINLNGSLTCSGRTNLQVRTGPGQFPLPAGTPVELGVESIDCDSPLGDKVTVTSSSGETVALQDDGTAPDRTAGDGIYSARWTPGAPADHLVFSSPAGTISLPGLALHSSYVPEAHNGSPFQFTLKPLGGVAPYSWAVTSGALPTGLALTGATGLISGTATVAGVFDYTLRLTDAIGQSTTAPFSQVVAAERQERWFTNYDTGFEDHAGALDISRTGIVFVAGSFQNPATGKQDLVAVTYDNDHTEQWSRTISLDDDQWVGGAAFDSAGNVYVASNCLDYTCYGDYNLTKLNPGGTLLWQRSFRGGTYGYVAGVVVDSNDNVYVAGNTSVHVPGSLTTEDALVLKYTPDGTLLWNRQVSAGALDYIRAVVIDRNDALYLAGALGDMSLNYSNLVVKMDANGNTLWTRTRYSGWAFINAADIDRNGNLLTLGEDNHCVRWSPDGAVLAEYSIPAGTSIANDSNGDFYTITSGDSSKMVGAWLRKYNANGTQLWAEPLAGKAENEIPQTGLLVDGLDNLYALRHFDNTRGDGILFSQLAKAPIDGRQIAASPLGHNFGDVPLSTVSAPQRFTVKNSGTATLTVGAVGLSGADATHFSIQNDQCSAALLPAGSECTVEVLFHSPATAAIRAAQLEVTSNDQDRPTLSLWLQGGRLPGRAAAAIAPADAYFGVRDAGQPSAPQQYTVTNTGTADLQVSAVTITGTGAAHFQITTNGCGGHTLAPGATCTVAVVFRPTAFNLLEADLALTTNDPLTPTITSHLQGVGGRPSMTVTPADKDFGYVLVGQTARQTFIVANGGPADLLIDGWRYSYPIGTDGSQLSIQNNTCDTKTIAPGQTCSFDFVFTPTKVGAISGFFGLYTNDPARLWQYIPVFDPANDPFSTYYHFPQAYAGIGVTSMPAVAASLSFYLFQTVKIPGKYCAPNPTWETKSITLSNTGVGDRHLGAVIVNGDNFSDFIVTNDTCSNATLAPGAHCEVAVTFHPIQADDWRRAALHVPTDDPALAALEIGLQGLGLNDSDCDGAYDLMESCPFDPAKTVPGTCGCGVADQDSDGDSLADCQDNCPLVPNADQGDADADGVGDLCDRCADGNDTIDSDHDGVPDCAEACPSDPLKTNPGVCGCGTADLNSDSDPLYDCIDNCPLAANETQADADADGVGDACDRCPGTDDTVDSDHDGMPDCLDSCAQDPQKTEAGTCGCGVSDHNADADTKADCQDNCPFVVNEDQLDGDGDGFGDLCDCGPGADGTDGDGDGWADLCDNCQQGSNPSQADSDGDGTGDACDMDSVVLLPETGQTKCYGSGDTPVPCPGSGEDGELRAGVAWPDPRFIDNQDGTITDRLTGLMWLKDAQCLGKATWNQGPALVENFNNHPESYTCAGYSGRYHDWVMPNIVELDSLYNANEPSSTGWLQTQGFVKVGGDWDFLSSTAAPGQTAFLSEWMGGGTISPLSYRDATYPNGYSKSIWPVRTSGIQAKAPLPRSGSLPTATTGDDGDLRRGVAWPNPRFSDLGNGVVRDNLTRLEWLRDGNCFGPLPWQNGLATVAAFNSNPAGFSCPNGGHSDWRMPNRRELFSMNDFAYTTPGFFANSPFINYPTDPYADLYWTSTTNLYWTGLNAMASPLIGGWFRAWGKGDSTARLWLVRGGNDNDDDGVDNAADNCPLLANSDQKDIDNDGAGDLCDLCPGFDDRLDADHDGRPDGCDACPADLYKVEPGVCGCGVVDSGADGDNDQVADCIDNCLQVVNTEQSDSDGDGTGDACDLCPASDDALDADGDGVPDGCDLCPGANDLSDSDGDGVADGCDNCPQVVNTAQSDSDGDGTGDACDLCPASDDALDADGDGVPDGCDLCPGANDLAHSDGDGVADGCDNCPRINNPAQSDTDNDGSGDQCDFCPGIDDRLDQDRDGVPDCSDTCPGDPNKPAPGACGCGFIDYDADDDGVADCLDNCRTTANADQADQDGDGQGDACDTVRSIFLPRTGQNTCYNTAAAVIPCDGTGQDGEFQLGVAWPENRFVDNGDGTLTDTLTGLMWLKDADCFAKANWPGLLTTVANFNSNPAPYQCAGYTASYSDWVLPNMNELASLINMGSSNPSQWLADQGFVSVASLPPAQEYYATSTLKPNSNAISVRFDTSAVAFTATSTYQHIWPVRTSGVKPMAAVPQTGKRTSYYAGDDGDLERGVALPSPRFTDLGNGVIRDHLTKLEWLADTGCLGNMTWQAALTAVADFNRDPAQYSCANGGHTDWRLPNFRELLSVGLNPESAANVFAQPPFIHYPTSSSYWWTSTTSLSPGTYPAAATVAPSYLYSSSYGKTTSPAPFVIAVRGGNDQDGDGFTNEMDNCPLIANPDQADGDGDGVGDLCDPCPRDCPDDRDGDGVCDSQAVDYNYVLDAPHNRARGVRCASCHSFSLWWQYAEVPSSDPLYGSRVVSLCLSCHGAGGTAHQVRNHSSDVLGPAHGTWLGSCNQCHDAHFQGQLTWAGTVPDSDLYLVQGTIGPAASFSAVAGTTTFAYTMTENSPNWGNPSSWADKNGTGRGLIFVRDRALTTQSFEIISATATTITVQGMLNPASAGTTFGLIYGQLIRDEVPGAGGLTTVKFFDPKGSNGFTNQETPQPTGICQACHTETTYWRHDNSGAPHHQGTNCAECHPMANGFAAPMP